MTQIRGVQIYSNSKFRLGCKSAALFFQSVRYGTGQDIVNKHPDFIHLAIAGLVVQPMDGPEAGIAHEGAQKLGRSLPERVRYHAVLVSVVLLDGQIRAAFQLDREGLHQGEPPGENYTSAYVVRIS